MRQQPLTQCYPQAADLDYAEALRAQVMSCRRPMIIFDHYSTKQKAQNSWIEFSTDVMFPQPMRLWATICKMYPVQLIFIGGLTPIVDGSDKYGVMLPKYPLCSAICPLSICCLGPKMRYFQI